MSFKGGFKVTSQAATTTSNVDFNAMNKYVVETVDCEQPETVNGIIAGIVDLGNQPQPDAEFDVAAEDKDLTLEELNEKYADDIEVGKIKPYTWVTDYKTKEKSIKKIVPQPNRQSVVLAVDFPDILVDKGQFFGESNPLPLRLWTGGQYWDSNTSKMYVQRTIPVRWKKEKINGKDTWTIPFTNQLYKIAVASKVIKQGEAFLPENITDLIGKTVQWKVQVFMKKGNDGKEYYNERLSFVGGIQRKDTPFESDNLFLVQVTEEADVEDLKQIRKHIWNTMELATNYEGSALQLQKKAYDEGNLVQEESNDEGEEHQEESNQDTTEQVVVDNDEKKFTEDGWD